MSTQPTSLASKRAAAITALPPWALVVVAVISVQLGAAVAKQLFDAAGWTGVVFLRTFLGGIVFLVLMRPQGRGHSLRVYGFVLLYGATIAANMLTFYAAISRIPLGITVAIAFAGPLTISVLGSRRALDLVWVGLAAGGILLLSPITDATLDPVGVLLALACAAAWAVFIVVTKRASSIMSGNTMLALGMCAAALVSAPFGAVSALAVLDAPALIGLALVVALLSSVIPFWLEFAALRRLSPRVFGLLLSLEPVTAALIGWVVLSENLGIEKIAGIALVTIAAVATTRSES